VDILWQLKNKQKKVVRWETAKKQSRKKWTYCGSWKTSRKKWWDGRQLRNKVERSGHIVAAEKQAEKSGEMVRQLRNKKTERSGLIRGS
jgi:hypothetical protein